MSLQERAAMGAVPVGALAALAALAALGAMGADTGTENERQNKMALSGRPMRGGLALGQHHEPPPKFHFNLTGQRSHMTLLRLHLTRHNYCLLSDAEIGWGRYRGQWEARQA